MNLEKLKYLFYSALLISVAAGFMVTSHPYFWWESLPAFYAVFGLTGSIIIAAASWIIGRYLVRRGEDYYD
ncbi:MAG TPA: FHIPEP family type III secretion protein [Candidatus Methanoperedenaceae archaeon]|nr:FHIPEP family type III secretion protein [Candidatus Methanoperedenaceae archaeon]